MALVTDTPTPQPTEREKFDAAMIHALRAMRMVQEIGVRYFYGPHGGRHSVAEMQRRIDEYKANAAALFTTSELIGACGYVATGEVPAILPNGISYAKNPDGTVTLSGAVDEPAPVVEE
jgi:hypothetical protein